MYAIQRDNVPQVQRGSLRMQACGNSFQLLLVLGSRCGHRHGLCGVAKEAPLALGLVRRLDVVDIDVVFNLARQQVAVLKADLLRRALQMHIRPSALVELVGAVQARIRRRCERTRQRVTDEAARSRAESA